MHHAHVHPCDLCRNDLLLNAAVRGVCSYQHAWMCPLGSLNWQRLSSTGFTFLFFYNKRKRKGGTNFWCACVYVATPPGVAR